MKRVSILIVPILFAFTLFGTEAHSAEPSGDPGRKIEGPILPEQARREEPTNILVKFKRGVPDSKKAEIFARHGLKPKSKIDNLGVHVLAVSENDTAQEVIDRLKAKDRGAIEFAEADELVPPTFVPNDPLYAQQWHHPVIGSPAAWDTANGSGIVAAICDTGVEATHPDLLLVPGWNTVSNNSDTSPVHWHGTSVAGTTAAIGNNATLVAGAAYGAKIMPMRVSDRPDGNAYFSDIAEAIQWAADHGAKTANASYGAGCSATVQTAGAYLRSKGGLATISAGNDGTLSTACADSPDLIVVSATNSADQKTSWSTYGNFVDIAAPGEGILTTYTGGGSASVSGTSFSAPMTSGILSLIWSVKPTLTPDEAQAILFQSATDLGVTGRDTSFGWGRINAAQAVALALSYQPDTTPPSVPGNLTANVTATQITLQWNASTDNQGVAGYDVYRGNRAIASVAGTSYADTNIASGATYTYYVTAYDGANNVSGPSNSVTVTVPASLQITSYSVTNKTATSVAVRWQTNVASTGYVKYGLSPTALTRFSATTPQGTSHTVTLGALSRRTTYYYQIVGSAPEGTASTPVSTFRTLNK